MTESIIKKNNIMWNIIILLVFQIATWLIGTNVYYANSTKEYNFDKTKAISLYPEAVLSVQNCEQEGNKFFTLHEDPQINILPPKIRISSVLVVFVEPVPVDSSVKIYYAKNNKSLNEENSVLKLLPKGSSEVIINLPSDIYTALRCDIDIFGEWYEIKGIYVSKALKDNTLFITSIISICIFVLWIIGIKTGYINKYFTKYINTINKNLIIDFIVHYRLLISLCIFFILVLFEFHGSSIDMYNNYIPDENITKSYKSPVIGKVRGIRSDEWVVNTPNTFAQITDNTYFPLQNNNISLSGTKLFQYNIPVLSINLLAKPSHWGYFLLNKAKGLSWFWWSRFFFLLLSSFEVCMFLTDKNKTLSIFGSFLITFAPPVQWWYATQLVDIIYYGQFFFISILYYINNLVNNKRKILFAVLAFFSASGFCMCLYPPFLIPMGYTIIALLISLFIIYYKKIKIKKLDILIISATVFVTIILLGYTFFENYDQFQKTMNTVYPGKRFFSGGLDFKSLLTDITCWLLPYKDVIASNNCEYSRFITFLPLIIFLGPFIFSVKNDLKKIQMILYIFLLIQLAWYAKLFPTFILKITLLSMVSSYRAIVLTGLTATYLGLSIFSSVCKEKPIKLSIGIFISIIICILYNYAIVSLPYVDEYLGKFHIITIVFFMTYNFIFIMGYKKLFYIFTCVIIILSIPVNPMARGIDSIYNKKITYQIQKVVKEEPDKWWITQDPAKGNYLAAIGAKTLSATNFVPDFEKFKILDPNEKYINIYNRYAHQNYSITEEDTSIELLGTDNIIIHINKYDILKLNIGFILYGINDDLSRFNDDNIKFAPIFSTQYFVIYKVTI